MGDDPHGLCIRAQGKGIFLFTKLSQISDWRTDCHWQPQNQQVETYVVQKYLSGPYLVGGKKVRRRQDAYSSIH